jgi:hypothetical protein
VVAKAPGSSSLEELPGDVDSFAVKVECWRPKLVR